MVQHVFVSVFMFALPRIFCCLLLVTFTVATSGPQILYCRENAGLAQFNFSMPTWTKQTPLVIVHPDGRPMMTRYGHFHPMREGIFYERISNVETRRDRISFKLNGVSASDAGNYICRDATATGHIVGLCGQSLHFIDVKTPHVRESGLAVRDQPFHLNCEVYVPDEAPHQGLNFSFRWFKDGQPIPDCHGRVLTFPSVQLSDEGEYTCQVTEKTKECGSSKKSFPFSLHVIIPPSVSIKRHGNPDHMVGYLGTTLTLTCVVQEAFPRVPLNGFSWTFSLSDSSPAQQLQETGDTLTLGPLTRENSGQYTCQARNNQNYLDNPRKWSSGTDSINLTVNSRDEGGSGKHRVHTNSSDGQDNDVQRSNVDHTVHGKPTILEVCEGGNVTLTIRLREKCYKEPILISHSSYGELGQLVDCCQLVMARNPLYSGRVHISNCSARKLTVKLREAQTTDSGLFMCKHPSISASIPACKAQLKVHARETCPLGMTSIEKEIRSALLGGGNLTSSSSPLVFFATALVLLLL